MFKFKQSCFIFAAILFAVMPLQANAWGASGHRMLSIVGIESLPAEVPPFLKTQQSLWSIGELGREPDRSRGAGESHDSNLNPGHYINLGDSGLVKDLVSIDPLPINRKTYSALLEAKGLSEYQLGYLPYSIVDGWQQIRKDFTYWRADIVGARASQSAEERVWYEQDRQLREMLILRDIGYWSHFVADASQPMHVSVHYNGWGDFPNPEGFTTAQTLHASFEGQYVATNIKHDDVVSAMPAVRDFGCAIEDRTVTYLLESLGKVIPLYRLEKSGAFENGNTPGQKFVVYRLVAGAAEIRDMVLAAWRCSDTGVVGYPPVSVNEVEDGKRNPFSELRGKD
jgi:hypothetical protein